MTHAHVTLLLVDNHRDEPHPLRETLLSCSTPQYSLIDYNDVNTVLDWLVSAGTDLPDCMILNLRQSPVGNTHMLRILKQSHHNMLPLPVIVLLDQAEDDAGVALDLLALGAQHCIIREEFHPASLSRHIRHAIARHEVLHQVRKDADDFKMSSTQFSRSILDNSPDCIKIIDISGRLLDMNEGGRKQMHITDFSQVIHTPWHEFWPVEERHKAIEAIHLARQGKTSWFEGFCPTMAGTARWWEVVVTPIMNPDQVPERILSMSRDITERKTIQTKLQDALVEAQTARCRAEEANSAKSEFLANMSHEIRTPMNAVVGLANILAISDPLTTKQREFIQTLQISADTLLVLINDLLDIAKIEARSLDIEQIPFNLSQLMQDIISVMSLRAREKGLSFTIDDTAISGITHLGDPARLKQIIINLCSNAIKFTHHGGISIVISREVKSLSPEAIDQVKVTVRDTGIGIAQDKIDAIFEKFIQGDNSINRHYGGTGLGLAITKNLLEAMNGTVNVTSVPGEGSAFTLKSSGALRWQKGSLHLAPIALPRPAINCGLISTKSVETD